MTNPFRAHLRASIAALIFVLVMLTALPACAEIVLKTPADLIALASRDFSQISSETIKLANDIDMMGQKTLTPIGGSSPFSGTFDGQGHYIRNLSITGTGNCTGLFGYVGREGKIQNLGLYDVTVNGKNNTGSIAGVMTGEVSQCYATGSVSGKKYTGGLVGLLHAGTIENCLTDVSVSGSSYSGGLLGGCDYHTRAGDNPSLSPLTAVIKDKAMVIRNNLTLGSVSGGGAGGMLGDMGNSNTSPLASFDGNVMWNTSVSSTGSYGPVFSWWTDGKRKNDSLPMSYDNLYWNEMPLSGENTYASDDFRYTTYRMVAAESAALEDQKTYASLNWDFSSVWTWNDVLGHPVLKNVAMPNEFIVIRTVADFLAYSDPSNFADINGKTAILMNNLNLAGVAIEPIGGSTAFNGVFDGRGHTLQNLVIEGTGNCTGLFGHVGTEGEIKNLGLDRVSVTGGNNTGSIAGVMTGTIRECFVTGSVTGATYTGGIAGMLHTGTIENCWADVSVLGTTYAGGVFGGSDYNTRDKNNSSSPLTSPIKSQSLQLRNVLALGTVTASNRAGGILGDVGNSSAGGKIVTFEGNVAWIDQIQGKNYGPIYGWFSEGQTKLAPVYENVYLSSMLLPGDQPIDNMNDPLKVSGRTSAQLGKQETYETGLGWDFKDIWVWSTALGHPVLQGFTEPDDYIPGEQKAPASLVTTFAGSPKTTRAFTWYTDSDITRSVIQFVKAEDYANITSFANVVIGTSYNLPTSETESRSIHKVNVTGLEPGTTYYYRAGDGTYWSRAYTFSTEPESADSFTFFSMTDTQDAYSSYANVLQQATATYPESAFILHGGDVIQENATPDYDALFRLTSKHTAVLPSMVTPGNHELAKDVSTNNSFTPDFVKGLDNYLSHYQFPDNGPQGGKQVNYSFDYGDAHFIVLNSNTVGHLTYEALIEWLKADIAATDKTWKIVSLHHGPYSAYGTSKPVMIKALEELKIDLVLFGHNHVVLRSNPIANGTPADPIQQADGSFLGYATAPSYYSSGCAGGNASFLSSTNERHQESLKLFAVNQNPVKGPTYGAITVTADSITIRTHTAAAARASSQPFDTYVIRKPKATGSVVGAALTYNGRPQKLIDSTAAEGGDMLYSLDGVNFSTSVPTAVDAGSYTVYCKVQGGSQNSDSDVQTIDVTIAPLDISTVESSVTLGEPPVHTGKEVTQTVESVTANGLPVTYKVEGNTGKDVGEYALTITGTSNFTGSVTLAWRIVPAPVLPQTGDRSALLLWCALAGMALLSMLGLRKPQHQH